MIGKIMICGVVISYNPSAAILTNIEALRGQVEHVLVVDNTPKTHSMSILTDLENLNCCTVIRNGKNLGMAAALNIGIRYAMAEDFEWVILFDQDSRICENFITGMMSGCACTSGHGKAGVLFPRCKDSRLGVFLPTDRAANGDVRDCMTSGSMVHAGTFRALGMMDEELFIDYVDLDFCLRLRAAGLKLVECPEAVLMHSLGRMTQHRLLGKTFSTTNHSAKRRYYITRNRLVVMRRYFRFDRQWAFGDFRSMVKESIKILFCEKDKLAKAGYMLRGIFDAAFNRLGPRVEL
jgi:rhamnosyltransferase